MHVIEQTYVSLLADVANLSEYSEIRGSYEGLQWCLNEAPKLEKLVLASIETGVTLDLSVFPTWLRRLAAGSLVDPIQLRYLRQLLLFCYKASVTHDDQTTQKTFQGFLETNESVRCFGNSVARQSPRLLDRVRRHVQSVLFQLHPSENRRRKSREIWSYHEEDFTPHHGPGAVTTSKERWKHWYSTIESIYPYSDYLSLYFNADHCGQIWDTERKDIIEAKLIAVPKDSRGPRLICVHPAEAVWIQQGVRHQLERAISRSRSSPGPWPRGRIWFEDQGVNGSIALHSSRSRRYATIDMKEASDRISDVLVQILFGRKYKFFGCCRAQKFVIPKIGRLTNVRGDIHSYAPMGNATTFPVQSLVFWAICVASLQRQGHHQPGAAFVFGDDIIIPTECTEGVIDDLESFGLLVNRTKSFWRGAFRESCGVDAFKGVNTTPIRWKTTIDADHTEGLQSLSELAMRLRRAGYEEAAISTYYTLRIRLKARFGKELFTTNNPHHGGLAEYTVSGREPLRTAEWHPDWHMFVNRVWRLESVANKHRSDDWNRLLESVCSLERTGRASVPDRSALRRTRLNLGWSPLL
jgi:hypothetical protein